MDVQGIQAGMKALEELDWKEGKRRRFCTILSQNGGHLQIVEFMDMLGSETDQIEFGLYPRLMLVI